MFLHVGHATPVLAIFAATGWEFGRGTGGEKWRHQREAEECEQQ